MQQEYVWHTTFSQHFKSKSLGKIAIAYCFIAPSPSTAIQTTSESMLLFGPNYFLVPLWCHFAIHEQFPFCNFL